MKPEENPEDTGLRLTRKSPLALSRKFCPRCLTPLQAGSKLGGWLVPQDYYCPNCGYQGTVFLEKEPEKRSGDQP
ncbi:MAG: hypothetical protein HY296_00640 [Thaumarchaeota archaeon]|nr:hypothetical protein [Nitrososphaerota archaeon]